MGVWVPTVMEAEWLSSTMRDGLAITLTVVFVDRARKSAVTLPAGFFSAYEKPLPKTESGLRELLPAFRVPMPV